MDHRKGYLILENLSQPHIATHPQPIFLPHCEIQRLFYEYPLIKCVSEKCVIAQVCEFILLKAILLPYRAEYCYIREGIALFAFPFISNREWAIVALLCWNVNDICLQHQHLIKRIVNFKNFKILNHSFALYGLQEMFLKLSRNYT